MTTFLGLPLLTFLPVFAREIFHGDVGALQRDDGVLGRRRRRRRAGRGVARRFRHMGLTLLLVQLLFGVLIDGFALSRVFWLSNLLLFFAGAALLVVFSMTASLVQLIVAGSPARPGHEHLHGGVPRRHAARQPGERLRRHAAARRRTCSPSTARWSHWSRCTSWSRSHGVREL